MTGDTHVLRRLGKDITIRELRHMRDEEHMSNREIAQRLGTSYQTILKYLGSQRAYKRSEPTKKTSDGKVWTEAHSLTQLIGDTHEYIVDVYRGTCLMRSLITDAPLTRIEIHALINQLTYIEQLLQRAGK